MTETLANGENFANLGDAVVQRATDPVVSNVATPGDFSAQFPTPLDPTEVITMCEEINLLNAIPERPTGLKEEIWRELNELAFTSGSAYIAFADGACPEEFYHDGDNSTVTLKNLGAKKSLTISDIIHSQAVSMGGSGIRAMLGGGVGGSGLPGAGNAATMSLPSSMDAVTVPPTSIRAAISPGRMGSAQTPEP